MKPEGANARSAANTDKRTYPTTARSQTIPSSQPQAALRSGLPSSQGDRRSCSGHSPTWWATPRSKADSVMDSDGLALPSIDSHNVRESVNYSLISSSLHYSKMIQNSKK